MRDQSLFLLLISFLASAETVHEGRVIKIADGDTLAIRDRSGKQIRGGVVRELNPPASENLRWWDRLEKGVRDAAQNRNRHLLTGRRRCHPRRLRHGGQLRAELVFHVAGRGRGENETGSQRGRLEESRSPRQLGAVRPGPLFLRFAIEPIAYSGCAQGLQTPLEAVVSVSLPVCEAGFSQRPLSGEMLGGIQRGVVLVADSVD